MIFMKVEFWHEQCKSISSLSFSYPRIRARSLYKSRIMWYHSNTWFHENWILTQAVQLCHLNMTRVVLVLSPMTCQRNSNLYSVFQGFKSWKTYPKSLVTEMRDDINTRSSIHDCRITWFMMLTNRFSFLLLAGVYCPVIAQITCEWQG